MIDARRLIRSTIGLEPPLDRDPDFPCPNRAFVEGKPAGDCWTDGHYMCRECANADPEAIAERDER